MKKEFSLRAVQLDLARQMERVATIEKFIDSAADYGYNAVFLYMEWRIRTKTFDIGEEKGYTPDEIRAIVAHGASRGIDIIPGFAFFGHAGQVLDLARYEHLAELRGGVYGRESHNEKHVFCLSSPEVRDFIASYLDDVLGLFPTRYIHAGFDEALDVGYCSECREKVATFDSEQQLVLDHLRFCREIITGKYSKRMMIWDDLLPFYPRFIQELERDIVLVSWQYHQNVPEFHSYFGNLTFQDALEDYRKAGFDFLAAPVDFSMRNVETFTSYAERRGALGSLLTSWSKQNIFLERSMPTVAASGYLWSGKYPSAGEAFRGACRLFFGEDEMLEHALYQSLCAAYRADFIQSEGSLLIHTLFGPDEFPLASWVTALSVLRERRKAHENNKEALEILDDVISDISARILSFRSRKAAYSLLHGIDGESLSAIADEVPGIFAPLIERCLAKRRKCDAQNFVRTRDAWQRTLLSFEKRMKSPHTLLRVIFFVPVTYGNTRTVFTAGCGGVYTELFRGVFKIANGYGDYISHFERYFLLEAGLKPETLLIETNGYAGVGLSHIEFQTPEGNWRPFAVRSVHGRVSDAHHLLSASDSFAYFGDQDAFGTAEDRKMGETRHSVELLMRKQ